MVSEEPEPKPVADPRLVPVDRAIRLHEAVGLDVPSRNRVDVEIEAGVAHDRSVRWWRAMGFPEVPEEVVAFSLVDVAMARRLAALLATGVVDDQDVMRLARLLGASFSRIADAQISLLDVIVDAGEFPTDSALAGGSVAEDTATPISLLDAVEGGYLELLEASMLYVWRRHLLAALGRRLGTDDDVADQAVGFADLSGFSKVSQRLTSVELGEIIDAFERAAFDAVAQHHGRVVKLIGDEVMFVADNLDTAVDIALRLIAALGEIEEMPPLHCGIAYGPTVSIGGDVFGATVNLASRLTSVARPGTIVVPRLGADLLAERSDVLVRRVRRSYDLKGMGSTKIIVLRPAPEETSPETPG